MERKDAPPISGLKIVAVIVQTIGVIIIGALLAQVVLFLVSTWHRVTYERQRRTLALELLRCRVEAARTLKVGQEDEKRFWGGFRKFVVRQKVRECHDVYSFYLAPHDRKPLPRFQPGQHLVFKLHIPDTTKPVVRCYSLSDSPTQSDYYRITIKRELSPSDNPDVPAGLVSSYFHNHLQEGDILDVKAPSGKFFLDLTSAAPVAFVAGGVGITPLLSMLNSITEGAATTREVWLFYGVSNGTEHIMKDHLAQLNHQYHNVHVHVCYSQPSDADVIGEDYDHSGRVSVDLLRGLLPSNNYEFFLCGPPAMMDSLTKQLKVWGIPEDKIFFEAFGSATVKKTAAPPPRLADATQVEVFFSKTGKRCQWDQKHGSLLELAEGNAVQIDFGCRAGSCGTCLTAIKAGDVTYMTEPGVAPEAGSCFPCIAIPKGHVTLDA